MRRCPSRREGLVSLARAGGDSFQATGKLIGSVCAPPDAQPRVRNPCDGLCRLGDDPSRQPACIMHAAWPGRRRQQEGLTRPLSATRALLVATSRRGARGSLFSTAHHQPCALPEFIDHAAPTFEA